MNMPVFFKKRDWVSEWVSENVTTREAIASKNNPIGPMILKNYPKIRPKSKVRIEGYTEN